jgi:hypothetical protein
MRGGGVGRISNCSFDKQSITVLYSVSGLNNICSFLWLPLIHSKIFFNNKKEETKWCHDNQHNDTQHNDIQHNDIQQNDTQQDDTQHNDIQHNDAQHYDTQLNDIQNNDTQHNDAQHNDTQLDGLNWDTKHK